MTIDEAIELLKPLTNQDLYDFDFNEMGAVNLGMEALKGIMSLRRGHGKALSELLPGETKD